VILSELLRRARKAAILSEIVRRARSGQDDRCTIVDDAFVLHQITSEMLESPHTEVRKVACELLATLCSLSSTTPIILRMDACIRLVNLLRRVLIISCGHEVDSPLVTTMKVLLSRHYPHYVRLPSRPTVRMLPSKRRSWTTLWNYLIRQTKESSASPAS
jgi:hypothetical protein